MDEDGFTPEEAARLRAALAIIGAEAGRVPPADALAGRRTRKERRRGAFLASAARVAAAGVAAVAGLTVVGAVVLGIVSGSGPGGAGGAEDGGGQGLTLVESVACADFVAEGEVTGLRPSDEPGRIVLGLAVEEPLVPAGEAGPVELDIPEPDPDTVPRVGERVFVLVYGQRDIPADLVRGAAVPDMTAQYREALPAAEGLECPDFWRDAYGYDEPGGG
ncbi:hypothetical protein [Streptomyces sp. NPDC049879]|uniref:hypothetical protein n=1 Tax=Streptomyces sp. NPDC049879 TaxID=3365598 RepID=UPI0037B3870D